MAAVLDSEKGYLECLNMLYKVRSTNGQCHDIYLPWEMFAAKAKRYL